jgi:hypothetical protein
MKRSSRSSLATLFVTFACAASLSAATVRTQGTDTEKIKVPNGKGQGVDGTRQRAPEAAPLAVPQNGIQYHGGPVMLNTHNIYLIWYGTWSSSSHSILTNLAQSIGGSPYFNINTTYTNSAGTKIANTARLAGEFNDNYSRGRSLSDAAVRAIVASVGPTDTNGIYFVMGAKDVNETSGFCTQYCGWHDHATINGRDIKYSFVGNPARCPSSCTTGDPAPNGNVGADGAASIFAHELEEAITDPDLNAWFDSSGEENADKCAWTFGSTYSNGTGTANMKLGGRDYLIQQNWVNASGGRCAKSF